MRKVVTPSSVTGATEPLNLCASNPLGWGSAMAGEAAKSVSVRSNAVTAGRIIFTLPEDGWLCSLLNEPRHDQILLWHMMSIEEARLDDWLAQIETDIYEAAIVPEKWTTVLDGLAARVGSAGGVLFGVSTAATSWMASPGIYEAMSAFVADGWAANNTRMATGISRNLHLLPRFVTEADYFSPAELAADPTYRGFFYPRGFGVSAGTVAFLPHDDMLCFSFERRADLGPFSAESLGLLDAVRPHLLRASLITARLGMEQIRTAIETLTAVGLPAVAVSQTGRVLEANALFAAAGEVWTTRGHDQIVLQNTTADAMLTDALAALGQAHVTRSIPIRQGAGQALTGVVQVIPLRRLALDIFGNMAAILVLSAPGSGARASAPALLLSLFDLTPAELEIARHVAAGRTVSAIAVLKQRSVATVRNQLQSVMQKTGSSRQADLIILLRSLPGGG
ncbi:MAG: helix-turn-helix transcriptional regulator [Hyphomicrobiales bacterium]|nr:MAG: helix-turn-helix transcriptional regulator [Hyphomicrobiales bacterium]